MSDAWLAEIWRLFAVVAVTFLVGALFGHGGLFVAFGLLGYLGWHLHNLRRLDVWLRTSRTIHPPEAGGLWGEIFDHFYRLQQRNRSRKRRLTGILHRVQEATSAMPDATVIIGASGDIEWFNDAAQHLLGLVPGKDIGQRLANLLRHPDVARFLQTGDPKSSLLIPAPGDETLTLSLRIVPYGNDQKLLLARDVSQQQRLEQIRRDFVGNVSHELRTPLTVVKGFVETLAESGDECATRWHRSLELMQQQTGRMQQIVEDLLLLTRLETDRSRPPREEVVMSALLGDILHGVMPLAERKHQQLTLDCDSTVNLFGAERELYSAFTNLVTNAIRYTPEGGTIRLRWWADPQGGHFAVSDSGVGIEPQHIPRLTERFYRVDVGRSRDSGGTGLGLAIVKHVLNRHGARLRIDSRVGEGSTFTCDFSAASAVHRHIA
ncbi:MAG TPA: phosphate regulon sensor histidine kinase PhoR [Gammaproteobacteria bacterium]